MSFLSDVKIILIGSFFLCSVLINTNEVMAAETDVSVSDQIAAEKEAKRLELYHQRLIAALTSSQRSQADRAVRQLIREGDKIVPEMEILLRDNSSAVRVRVVQVLGGIASPICEPLIRSLHKDSDEVVRAECALALGACRSEKLLPDLRTLLFDESAMVRDAAALGLGLSSSPDAIAILAQRAAIEFSLSITDPNEERRSRRALKSMRESLKGLCAQPAYTPMVLALIEELDGGELIELLLATYSMANPRLSPPLAQLALTASPDISLMACESLKANGDSRCIEALVRLTVASKIEDQRIISAETLRHLTGYRAGPGQAWSIWWDKHHEKIEGLYKRDAFIARCHEFNNLPSKAELGQFSCEELMPLLDGMNGGGAAFWPRQCWKIIENDEPGRWINFAWNQYQIEGDERVRIQYLALVHALGGAEALLDELRVSRAELIEHFDRLAVQNTLVSSSELAMLNLVMGEFWFK